MVTFYPSETGLLVRSCNINQDKREAQTVTHLKFLNWLVGFTDGDGCFNIYIDNKGNKINFTFKISQHKRNKRVLHYIKKNLKYGIISKIDSSDMVHYNIRRKDHLEKVILPLFSYLPLKTIKQEKFLLFKQCFYIYNDPLKDQKYKLIKIQELIKNPPLISYFKVPQIRLNKNWLVGFIEADGSFYITSKDKDRLVHGFGITQKYDRIILSEIQKLFGIKAEVKWNKKGFWSLDATGYKSLKRIKDYFFKSFKGVTSLYYRIWSRSFRDRGKFIKLLSVQKQLRKL